MAMEVELREGHSEVTAGWEAGITVVKREFLQHLPRCLNYN